MIASDPNVAKVELIAKALGPLRERLVLVGGCAAGLLFTDPAAAPARVTYDVDLLAEVAALSGYHQLEKEFSRLGGMLGEIGWGMCGGRGVWLREASPLGCKTWAPDFRFAIHLAPARALGLARHKNVRRDIPVSMLLQDDNSFGGASALSLGRLHCGRPRSCETLANPLHRIGVRRAQSTLCEFLASLRVPSPAR